MLLWKYPAQPAATVTQPQKSRRKNGWMDGWMDGWMMFTLHVYNLTFMLGGEGDGGEVTARQEGCQVSDRSL